MPDVTADMAGVVFKVNVSSGQRVEAGQDVVVLESMKMEIPITALQAGEVAEIKVQVGDFVQEGQVVVVLK